MLSEVHSSYGTYKKHLMTMELHMTITAQKISFPLRIAPVNVTKSVDLVTFIEEILNGKLHFLCSVYIIHNL